MLITSLPSKYPYQFNGINLHPLNFGQLLEYLNESPNSDLDKFVLDYSICRQCDANVDKLLLTDFFFIVFMEKLLTINKKLEFNGSTSCPECNEKLHYKLSTSDIKFNPLDEELMKGLTVKLASEYHKVQMPTVSEFFNMIKYYRAYHRNLDFKLLKIYSLFVNAQKYPGKYEDMITKATYEEITLLLTLEELYLQPVKSINIKCSKCGGTVAVSPFSLAADMFHLLLEENRLTEDQILFK